MALISVIEFVPVDKRNFCGILGWIPFAIGEATVALLGYFFRDWRWLHGATTIPSVLLFTYYW